MRLPVIAVRASTPSGADEVGHGDREHRRVREGEKREVQGIAVNGGAACLGDPLNAVAWLAATARNFGDPLRAGQVILSGALGPMAAVGPGSLVYAEITAAERLLGSVSARFDTAEEQS